MDPTGEIAVATLAGACLAGAVGGAAINAVIGALAGRKPTRRGQVIAAGVGCGLGVGGSLFSAAVATARGFRLVHDLISGSRFVRKTAKAINLSRPGGRQAAHRAFDAIAKAFRLTAKTVHEPQGPVKVLTIPKGPTLSLREFQTFPGAKATIEVIQAGIKRTIKIRYF